jgi:hypothetical protein
MVMCSEPVMRAPLSGCAGLANSSRMAIRPGISVSAILISLRPQSARPMSAMTQSVLTAVECVRSWFAPVKRLMNHSTATGRKKSPSHGSG